MKPVERDHHAAQLSVGLHAKASSPLPALLALGPQRGQLTSPPWVTKGSPLGSGLGIGRLELHMPPCLRGPEELCPQHKRAQV